MEYHEHFAEFKEPIKILAKEITRLYVEELTREATIQAVKNKTKRLSKREIEKLEKEITDKSCEEYGNRLNEAAYIIQKDVQENNIKGNKTIEQVTDVLNATIWFPCNVDPVVDVEEILSIEYDLNNAKIIKSNNVELYRQIVTNDTDQPQTTSINGSQSITETSEWSDTLGVKVGISSTTKVSCGIPGIFTGNESATLSGEMSNSFTWNGSTSKQKSWGFNTPVTVPPHEKYVASVSVMTYTISVPYVLTGTALLKSGKRVPMYKINGTYVGTNSHDLTVIFTKQT